jgi:hypothetical protein
MAQEPKHIHIDHAKPIKRSTYAFNIGLLETRSLIIILKTTLMVFQSKKPQ